MAASSFWSWYVSHLAGRHDETVGADESIEMPEPVEAVTVECSVLHAAVDQWQSEFEPVSLA